ncbi:MAG: hypothetical protein V3W31_01315 [Thermodesulfobacteriota bacterium]
MKIYRLPKLTEANQGGEYLLGHDELGSRAVYLAYGRLRPGETGRRVSPGEGCEEIVYVVKGRLRISGSCGGSSVGVGVGVGEGEAFHVSSKDSLTLDNPDGNKEAVFVAAGGRIPSPPSPAVETDTAAPQCTEPVTSTPPAPSPVPPEAPEE